MKANYHTHTTRCMHATGSDEEYVRSAIKGGYDILGFSDHTPWKYNSDYVADMRMLPEELPDYIESLRSLREKYRDQIEIKIGLECEYFPDYIPWLKEQIEMYRLDYIIFGNHHYHTDEEFPYFGHHTDNRDMLDLYEESAIKGMESGLFSYLAHPDLFMRSYPKFDSHCTSISRHICRTAARLNLPLEYNIGYVAYNLAHGLSTYPCADFWRIAANEGCTAIIGLDAHYNVDLEIPVYYDQAIQALKKQKIKTIDTLEMLTDKA
ncbi:histidinol-phosphatase [Bacteroides sp.]|uniref:histidinol-phosphatase n=1 Tax=Bacteroides sp. TaxID=29523 RepID=UPI00261FA401|nr:histidinol-phosphatase [Bacteroides sp.]